jgi:phytoene dehydrogenase-like protein
MDRRHDGWDMVIIGGGIAGLVAGCYGQSSGLRTVVLERAVNAGGLCTSWTRKGYTVDGCLHYLFGTGTGPFSTLWDELNSLEPDSTYVFEEICRVRGSDGRELIGYADPDRLEEHLLSLAPEDERPIRAFVKGIRTFQSFPMDIMYGTPRSLMTLEDWGRVGAKIAPFNLPLFRWGFVSVERFAARFRDPFLREAFPLLFGWSDMPMLTGMFLFANSGAGNAGLPKGGAGAFTDRVLRRYLSLGGEIRYRAEVDRIDFEDNVARGVTLSSGESIPGRCVVGAADLRWTLDRLEARRPNKRPDPRLTSLFTGDGKPVRSQCLVSFGVRASLSDEPHWRIQRLPSPIHLGGLAQDAISIRQFCHDPSFAPSGGSVIQVTFESDHQFWRDCLERGEYHREKAHLIDLVRGILTRMYPDLVFEMADLATPRTFEKWTGNWRGSACGWLLTVKTMALMLLGIPKTPRGLRRLYLAGQWLEPGGSVPLAAYSGRQAVQLACAELGVPFRSRPVDVPVARTSPREVLEPVRRRA